MRRNNYVYNRDCGVAGEQGIMNILITGGAGFIGSHLVERYCREGKHFVVTIDNLSSGRMENLDPCFNDKIKDFLFIEDDLGEVDIAAILKTYDIEIIHHVAARPRVGYSVDFPVESNQENITNTLRVLDAARKTDVKRVVYSASSSAYGTAETFPTGEDHPIHPLSPYALQKFVGEEYCRLFSELYGLDTVSLRYFNVCGPRSLADSEYSAVIPIFIEQMMNDKPVTIDGTGEQSRDFTHIANVIHGNRLAAVCRERLKGRVFNLACSDNISLNDLVDKLAKILDKQPEKKYRDSRPGDAFKTQAQITWASVILDYFPVVGFDEGLKTTVMWYKERFFAICKEQGLAIPR